MAQPAHRTDRAGQVAGLQSAASTREASIAQVMEPGHGFTSVSDKIAQIVLRPGIMPGWLLGFMIAFALMSMFLFAITVLLAKGTGI
jgi:hypothetical protein